MRFSLIKYLISFHTGTFARIAEAATLTLVRKTALMTKMLPNVPDIVATNIMISKLTSVPGIL